MTALEMLEPILNSIQELPPGVDDRLLVLLGALLVEDALDEFLLLAFPGLSRDEIEDRILYSRKVVLGRALHLIPDPTFAAIDRIGTLRNRFAHRLTIRRLDQADNANEIAALRAFVAASGLSPDDLPNPDKVFRTAIAAICLFLKQDSMHVRLLRSFLKTKAFSELFREYCLSRFEGGEEQMLRELQNRNDETKRLVGATADRESRDDAREG